MWRAEAKFKLDVGSEDLAEVIFRALEPEVESQPSPRVTVRLDLDGRFILVELKADSTAALRAAVNSYLRWISAVSRSLREVSSLRL